MSQTHDNAGNIKVLALPGSLRKDSFNRALLQAAVELVPPNIDIKIFSLARMPFYNQDVEAEGAPPIVRSFRDALNASDALLIATPEYNFGTSSVIKNAIEWASRPARQSPLNGKPVAIMGASPGRSGTARAQAQLRQMLAEPGALVVAQPEVLIDAAYRKFDQQRHLVDPETARRIRELLGALVDLVMDVRQRPAQPSSLDSLRRVS